MDNSTQEERLSKPLQTNFKQFQRAATFFTAYKGIFLVTNKNSRFNLTRPVNDDGLTKNFISPGANELESLNNEINCNTIEEDRFHESSYQFTIKTNFSTLGSLLETSSNITGN